MAILIDRDKRVLVQGITGREGLTRTRLMMDYGTRVVAGVTPGKGGQTIAGVPVFDSVREARENVGEIDISVLFIPAPFVRNAAIEALEAGIKLLVIVPDRVPIYDVLEIAEVAKRRGARFLGPNTLGMLSPDQGVVGMIGGQAANARAWFFPGPVGITSRSGGMTTSIAYYLAQESIGASSMIHVGGDAVVGLPHQEIVRLFEQDPQTEAIVLFGEIGTSQEEQVAQLIENGVITKPLIVYIGGKGAKSGTRFSHAGAIIESGRGTYEAKVARLREAGAYVVESFADLPRVTREALAKLPARSTRRTTPTSNTGWKTGITQVKSNEIRLRGYRIDELMGRISFAQAIFLAFAGELPSAQTARLLDAMLVSSIDHGATTPSSLAARTAASTGAPLNAAIAAGILSINRYHGGAIEDCMGIIREALRRAETENLSIEQVAGGLVSEYRAKKKRMAGFGHRVHTADPRAARLFDLAHFLKLAGRGVIMAQALEKALEAQFGKRLPINVDGAIAALLVDLELPNALANAFFIIARAPGLAAQAYEETRRQRPMRSIHPEEHEYDGPPPRELPD